MLPGTPSVAVWILRDPMPAGSTRRYRLESAVPASTYKTAVTCLDGGKYLRLRVGDQPVLQYNAAVVESPEGIAPIIAAAGRSIRCSRPRAGS